MAGSLVAGVVLAGTAIGFAVAQAVLRRQDVRPVDSTWWLGYVHDLCNTLMFLGFFAGLALEDFPLPLALLGAGIMAVAAHGLDAGLARLLPSVRAAAALGALLVAAALVEVLLAGRAQAGLRRLVGAFF